MYGTGMEKNMWEEHKQQRDDDQIESMTSIDTACSFRIPAHESHAQTTTRKQR